jgi:A/G-specific adenine glycosylase
MINDRAKPEFRAAVWEHYQTHGRHDLPWRRPNRAGRFDPYGIMVSEIMLQQTQVGRVIRKYREFLRRFPTLETLAAAPLGSALKAWSGLGYNRRAKFLHQAAGQIVRRRGGQFPDSVEELTKLPGIGPNTAGAIMAYAFNRPAVFIETNIRTVFIHHFFHDRTGVGDREILELAAETLDERWPREWYWALTDYGAYLKQTVGNLNRRSRAYTRQSKFEGSKRQLRGHIIRLLTQNAYSERQLHSVVADSRLPTVLRELAAENLIIERRGRFSL